MLIIHNGYMMDPESGTEGLRTIQIEDGRITRITEPGEIPIPTQTAPGEIPQPGQASGGDITVINASGKIVAPGLVDPHVHFRDPGFTYKEDIESGARAAAKGGFTSVIMMGNTDPHPDNPGTVRDMIKRGSETAINVYCCGNVTMGMMGKELSPMEELLEAGAVLFTDDGKPITDVSVMEAACRRAAELGKVISLHEEDPSYITDNGINAGEVARELELTGSPREAEISMVKRDIDIARKTGAQLTIQHISTAEAVDLVREAKKEGLSIYAEATPHHFTLTERAVLKYGSLAKMNPPLRLESDRQAIIEGIKDGAIETIATDHAPHARYEKDKPLREAPSGITGLETALALGVRELVKPGHINLMTLLERMTIGPAGIYGLDAGKICEGGPADLCIFAPEDEWVFDHSLSKSENTPFLGERLPGRIYATICRGQVIYRES